MFVFLFYVLLNGPLKDFWWYKLGFKDTAKDSKLSKSTITISNRNTKEENHYTDTSSAFPAKTDDNANL